MLHIIGIILKIIGIILAVILGILVLLVCIVLFVPIRYEGAASFPGTREEISARGKLCWFFHLISAQILYEQGEWKWKFRIAWKKKESEKTEDGLPEETPVSARKKVDTEKTKKLPETIKNEEEPVELGVENIDKKDGGTTQDKSKDERRREPGKEQGEVRQQKTEKFPSGWKKILEMIKAFFEKIKYTFSQICGKIRENTEKKEKIMEFLENEVHRSAFARLKKEMIWMKRFLKPNRLRMNLHFGFEDPYTTGQCLAVLSMLYPFAGEHMSIQPEFEEQVLEGEVYVKGTMRGVHLVIFAGKMLLDQHVRATYRNIRNFEF